MVATRDCCLAEDFEERQRNQEVKVLQQILHNSLEAKLAVLG